MLQENTFKFLKTLKKNNNKAWFDTHKESYLAAKMDFENLVEKIIVELGKIDIDISLLKVKDCTFRIYKDVRFSKDKTPYKTNMAAGFNRGGKKVHAPGYYFHLEPGSNFIGGGMWMPSTEELKKVRQEIDYNFKEFNSILSDKKFIKLFGKMEDENALSRPPQGYNANNPAIEYIKMRSFIVGKEIPDETVLSKNLLKEIMTTFITMKPLIDFLNKALD
jgi:uncharacterized protein (TIGR02453 family)